MRQDALDLAVHLARSAGRYIKERLSARHTIARKSDPADLVTEADLGAEKIIVEGIRERFPGHSIISEEEGGADTGSGCLWLVDPLDGTMNYAHTLPLYTVSIAAQEDGRIEVGVVYDPERDELFSALRGSGAHMNGKPISVSATRSLNEALLATGFPTSVRREPEPHLELFSLFLARAQGVRRLGSAALDMCYVASGRLDGFWELGLSSWDVAAAALIVEEAGGTVTDLRGGPDYVWSGELAATNGLVHEEMLRLVSTVPLEQDG